MAALIPHCFIRYIVSCFNLIFFKINFFETFIAIGVINFCNVLSSYSEKNNILSIKNLAKILQCPTWIVTCRHSLSHPSQNPPPLNVLHAAISFALQWMDKYFWSKWIGEQMHTIEPIPYGDSNAFQESINREANQIYKQTCEIMFSTCSKLKDLQRNIFHYSLNHLNEFLDMFVQALIFEVVKKGNIPITSLELPALLLRRSSKIFSILLTSFNSTHVLFSMLNNIIQVIQNVTNLKKKIKFKRSITHVGFCWLYAILSAVTKTARSTYFERCFNTVEDKDQLRAKHSFTFLSILYSFVKLPSNAHKYLIVDCFGKLVNIPSQKLHHLKVLTRITSGVENIKTVDSNNVRKLEDLLNTIKNNTGKQGNANNLMMAYNSTNIPINQVTVQQKYFQQIDQNQFRKWLNLI